MGRHSHRVTRNIASFALRPFPIHTHDCPPIQGKPMMRLKAFLLAGTMVPTLVLSSFAPALAQAPEPERHAPGQRPEGAPGGARGPAGHEAPAASRQERAPAQETRSGPNSVHLPNSVRLRRSELQPNNTRQFRNASALQQSEHRHGRPQASRSMRRPACLCQSTHRAAMFHISRL